MTGAHVALIYLDMDNYEPTRDCLQVLKDRRPKGIVVGPDEVNDPATPGETLAVKEVPGLGEVAIHRYLFYLRSSYFVLE